MIKSIPSSETGILNPASKSKPKIIQGAEEHFVKRFVGLVIKYLPLFFLRQKFINICFKNY